MAAIVGIFEAGDGVIGTGRIATYYPASLALPCPAWMASGVENERQSFVPSLFLA